MNNDVVMIPFVAHESSMNRLERANRRLWIIIIVMFIGFLMYLFIPSEVTEETIQDVNGLNNSEVHQSIGE